MHFLAGVRKTQELGRCNKRNKEVFPPKRYNMVYAKGSFCLLNLKLCQAGDGAARFKVFAACARS